MSQSWRYLSSVSLEILVPYADVMWTSGLQPGVRENILHQSKRNTGTAWT
jgi:hypothetical protein